MAYQVRPAVPADAERIAKLHVSTWQETYAHLLPAGFFNEEHSSARRRMWDHILGNGHEEWSVYVASEAHDLMGFAMSGPSIGDKGEQLPRERQLFSLYAAKAVHGTGVGQALLDHVLGDSPAMLWVAAQNPRAIAFYRRNGFEFDGVEKVDPVAPLITDARMLR